MMKAALAGLALALALLAQAAQAGPTAAAATAATEHRRGCGYGETWCGGRCRPNWTFRSDRRNCGTVGARSTWAARRAGQGWVQRQRGTRPALPATQIRGTSCRHAPVPLCTAAWAHPLAHIARPSARLAVQPRLPPQQHLRAGPVQGLPAPDRRVQQPLLAPPLVHHRRKRARAWGRG